MQAKANEDQRLVAVARRIKSIAAAQRLAAAGDTWGAQQALEMLGVPKAVK